MTKADSGKQERGASCGPAQVRALLDVGLLRYACHLHRVTR